MATAVDIPAPTCETREEQGGDLVDQATSNLINKLHNEEQAQGHTHNGLSTVEGGNFLTPPSIGEIHCEVNNSSSDVSMVTEKPDQTTKDETDIVSLGKPKSDDQPTAIAVNKETFSGGIQQNVEESDGLDEEEAKESKTRVSEGEEMYVQVETKYEKVGDVKPIEEDNLDNPKSGNTLESSAESLHVAPENIEASILGQEKNMKSFPEDQSSNITLHENSGETEEKSTDADTLKEILESLSTIASTSPEEGSVNAVPLEVSRDSANEKIIDGTGTQKEILENDFSNEDDKGNSTEHGEPRNIEFCENESTQSTEQKIESKIEKSEDPLHTTSEDINAPEIETRSCIEEQRVTTRSQGILDEKAEDEAVDADEMEGIIENVPTVVSIEKAEDNSLIQVGGPKMENEDHLEKDTEQPSQVEDFTGNLVTDEVKIDDENPSRAELLEEENTESALLKEKMQKDKTLESLHAALEDIKPSDLDQHTETTSFLEEKSLTENPQEILEEETEEKTIDAVSNEDNDFGKDSLIQVDAYLEKETEPSLTKASVEDANHDESINLVEPRIGNECNVVLQNAAEDQKPSASSEDIETACSHKEDCFVMSDNTIDTTNTDEATHDIPNVTTEIQHEHTEENSVTQVDCSQIEQEEHLGKDGENSSWTEAPIEETKADESKNTQELKNKGIDSMKAELENEKDTESTSVKEEAEVDNPIDSFQTVNQDIKATDSSKDTNNCSTEQLPTANLKELSSDQTVKESIDATEAKEESIEDIVTNIPDGDNAENKSIKEDCSQEPSLKDATMGNNNAEEPTVAHEAKPVGENEKITECTSVKEEVSTESSALGQDEETSSLGEKSLNTKSKGIMDDTKEDKTNVAIVAEEETPGDKENIGKTTPYEDIEENMLVEEDYPQLEQNKDLENDNENTSSREVLIRETTEGSLAKEEAQVEKPIESLQVPAEDIKASESCQETYSIDEKLQSADPEEIPCDKTEEPTTDSAYTENENLELQNVESVPNECSDNLQTEVEGPQKTSLEEASIGNNNDADSTIIYDAKFADEIIVKADLLGNEESIECALAKEEIPLKSLQEEAQGEKPIFSSQAAREEIKGSDSCQDTNCLIEEKSLTAYPQETSSDKTVRESTDAINRREESIENDFSNEDVKENSTEHGEPRNIEFCENENAQSTALKIQSQIKKSEDDLHATSEDINTPEIETRSCIEEQSVTTQAQVILDKKTEDKAVDADEMEGIIENVPTIVSIEKTENNSLIQVGGPEDHLEKETEQPSQVEDFTGNLVTDEVMIDDENPSRAELLELENEKDTESTSVKEEAEVDNPIDSIETANQDIKATDSSKDTNNCSAGQLPTANPKELSSDQTVKESIDATEAKEESIEDIVTNIPDGDNGDNTSTEEDCSQEPSLKDATMGNNNAEEPTVAHEAKPVGENEKITECTSVKEEVSIESPALVQDEETSPLGEKSLTTKPQGIMDDTKVDKSNGAIVAEEETPEDKDVATAPYEDIEENLLVEVDCKQAEQNEDSVNDSENTSLTEALIGDTGEGTLVKEEAHEEKHSESLQVATEDVQASDSCQETSSIEEQILTGDSQEISCDRIEEKTVDAAYTKENLEEVATKIPNVSDEGNSPIQVDSLQNPPSEDALIIIHEAKFADESKVKADLFQNETKSECGLVKEDVSVKSLQVENEDIKPTASSQEREISPLKGQDLTTNPQEIVGDYREDKTIDVTELKEEALEDKSNATSSHEDTIENSLIQVDCIQLEQNEDLEKPSESTSLAEAPTADTIENMLVKEKAEEEDHHIEALLVATEDMKASALCQESSSIEEQILTGDSQEISCDKSEENNINSAYIGKESFEDAAINVPSGNNEDSSPIEVDGSQKPSLKEASMENPNDHESTIRHDTRFADDLSENEKNIECDFVKEEASVKSLDVENEDTKATTSNQDIESGHIEEQGLITNPQGIKGEHKEDKIIDVTDLKEVTQEFKSNATISYENTTENSSVQVDCSQQEQNVHSEKDNEITSLTEALATDTTDSKLVKEEAQNEDHTESLQVANEDIKAFSPCQDTKTSSTEEQVLIADPEDISRDIEKTIDASDNEKTTEVQVENEDIKVTASSQDTETSHLEEQGLNTNPQGIMGDHEDKSYAATSYEDSKESSFVQVDCSQLEQNEHSEKDGESTSLTEAPAADTIESTLIMEEVKGENHIEFLQAATEDVKAFAPSQDTKTSSTEEQIQTVDPEDISRDKTIENTIDASGNEKTLEVQEKNAEGMLKEDAYTESSLEATKDIKASNSSEDRDAHSQEEQILSENPEGLKDENRESEIFPKDEVPNQIENIDFEARRIELKEEEDLKDMPTSVNIAVHEEKDSNSIAAKIPCIKDLDVVEEVAVRHLVKDPDSKQEESSITEVPEVHMIISHENVPDVTSLASEVVEEAKSCGDKTDTKKIAVIDDGSTMIPTNETQPETDPRGGPEAEAQVPDGEKEAELVQNDPTTEIDQKDIGQLLIKDSQVISEPKGVNDKEEKTNSDNCKEISGSSNSGVLEEESTSNFQESRREMREEAENEEAQQQEEELHISALVHDSSSGKIENHVQELEKPPLHASDENIIETTECNESEIVEDAIKNREGDNRTKSFFDDKKATEREKEETESGQEKLTSDEKVQTPTSTSDLEVIDFHSILPSETSKVDHYINEGEVATDREELKAGKIASDGDEDTRIDNDRSITDLETKNDDGAPEIIQTTPSASEGQDVESTSVGETTVLISECQRDGYEHANTSSATEERPDSKELVFEPGEQRSEYESKIQVLESVSQVQSGKVVAETEEIKTEEKNLETAEEIESDKVVAEDISGQEKTKHEAEILKTREGDKDVGDYHQGSHQEEVVIGSHLEEEANQEEEISTGFEDIKKENETEKVPKNSKECDDKALEEPEENLLRKESTDRGQDQKEQSKSVQEVTTAIDTEEAQAFDVAYVKIGAQNSYEKLNKSTVALPDEEENRTGADDTENEIAEDEGLLNQNSFPEIDAAAREMPKELDENITCEAPINTLHKTIEDSEVNKESQEEHITRKHEILPLPELVQGKESEKHNQKDEICGSNEVQPRDEENVTRAEEKGEQESKGDTWSKPNEGEETEPYVEPEQLDFSFHIKDIVPISDDAQVIPEDDESPITKNTSPGEECSNKSTKSQISIVTDGTELTKQASEATRITSEMQEPKPGISSQAAIPNATEVDNRQVEEANDKCKVVAETSTPVEPPMISTSKITLEVEDQHTKLHDLPQELNIMDTKVMAEKDDPENVQNVRDVSQDAQGSNEGSFEVSHKENPVEASPDENIKTGDEQETEAVQNASVLETLKRETEEQQLGKDPGNVTEAGVNSEEAKIINDKSNQLEKSWSAETEKVSESNTYQSLMDDTAQHDKIEGSPRQIDSLSILPEAKCSEIETAEKDIPPHFAGVNGTGVTELEVTPLPSKDKHVVLEADHTTVLSSENANGNEKLSAECSHGEHDLHEPSKVEQQAAHCGNEEKTDQETAEKSESKKTNEPSLSDLFEVSMRKTSKMAEHSAIDEEPTTHTEVLHAEKPDEDQHENAKTEEENNDVDELSEQNRSELSSEAPVMVDMADADVKVSHKKSHNILSGVGSKVKHSIAKVKKAITGKSSHPKPPSPKSTQVEK